MQDGGSTGAQVTSNTTRPEYVVGLKALAWGLTFPLCELRSPVYKENKSTERKKSRAYVFKGIHVNLMEPKTSHSKVRRNS